MNKIRLHEIDWNISSPFHYGFEEANSLINQIRKTNLLPLSDKVIFFDSDRWDFSEYTTLNIPKSIMTFNFKDTPEAFKESLKFYVLIKILENDNKIQTIHRKYRCLNPFFLYLSENYYNSIERITTHTINEYLTTFDNKAVKTKVLYKQSIKDFLIFYTSNLKEFDITDIEILLNHRELASLKAATEQNKYANIPTDYFNNLISALIKTIENPAKPVGIRAIACCILLVSQTGLRSSELLSLEVDSIFKENISKDKKACYLKFKTWKREKGNNIHSVNITYINEIAAKAYEILSELHLENRIARNTKLLFVPKGVNVLPVLASSFLYMTKRYYYYNALEIGCLDYEDLSQSLNKEAISKIEKTLKLRASNDYIGFDTISYPLTHQFRVYFCTDLYNKGVSLAYIQKFMSHLSSDMQGYYIRQTPKNPQENMNFSTSFLEGIVKDRIKLLGADSTSLNNKIEQFISEGNFNIAKDFKEIAEGLAKQLPIREKSGGVCIKSSIRECSKDAKTDEFYCAYDICPNIFHVFYMARISYDRYLNLIDTFTHNQKNGYLRQAEREQVKLKHVIKKRLLPELKELQIEIDKQGYDTIVSKYPDLNDIAENLTDIRKEALKWLQ